MSEGLQQSRVTAPDPVAGLVALRSFEGAPVEFWPRLIEGLAQAFEGRAGVLAQRAQSGWVVHGPWLDGRRGGLTPALRSRIEAFGERLLAEGSVGVDDDGDGVLVGGRLNVPADQPPALVMLIQERRSAATTAFCAEFRWLADIPEAYQASQLLAGRSDARRRDQLVEPYEIALALNEGERFAYVSMALCNEIAARFRCAQVSLGWLHDDTIRLRASSHVEQFEASMELVQALEGAMEEALDQNREVLVPPPAGDKAVTREHQRLVTTLGLSHLLTLPMRAASAADGGERGPLAAITCGRDSEPFTQEEVDLLRMTLDLVTPRLGDLQRHDRWFGARWWDGLRVAFERLLGPAHSGAKLLAIGVLASLALLTFGTLEYRVEAPFILRPQRLAYLPAPFDGYVEQVDVDLGDRVSTGSALLRLDTHDLRLQESGALADLARYSREEEKARAAKSLADMQIAQALRAQSQARLDEVRGYLGQAQLKAPFDGVVVEGELKKMLGAPVGRGDVLLKVAALDDLYLELELDERDAHEVHAGQTGEIAFISRPERTFAMHIERFEPQAEARDGRNTFTLRAAPGEAPEPWWRPGMSGVAKVEVGRRSLGWILSHRTLDYLRMQLWW